MTALALLDQDSVPSVRDTIVRLMSNARSADLAVGDVRLGGIDLTAGEAAAVARTRILLGRLDASSLALRTEQLETLRAFASSGRLQIRCAGLQRWTPDFSLYRGLPGDTNACLLLGAHYFRSPPANGMCFTACIVDPRQVVRAAARFERLWLEGYDVLPAILETIDHGLARADAGITS